MKNITSTKTAVTILNDIYIIEIHDNNLYLAKNGIEIKRPHKKKTLQYIADHESIDITSVGSGTQSLGWKIIKDNNTRRMAV